MSEDFPYSTTRDGVYVEIPPIDKLCVILKEKFKRLEESNERLKEKIKYLESENYKDEELSKIRSEFESMQEDYYRGFPITKEEKEKIAKYFEEHEKVCSGGHGTCGGKYSYLFTPTGIGTIGYIKCGVCGDSYTFQNL